MSIKAPLYSGLLEMARLKARRLGDKADNSYQKAAVPSQFIVRASVARPAGRQASPSLRVFIAGLSGRSGVTWSCGVGDEWGV